MAEHNAFPEYSVHTDSTLPKVQSLTVRRMRASDELQAFATTLSGRLPQAEYEARLAAVDAKLPPEHKTRALSILVVQLLEEYVYSETAPQRERYERQQGATPAETPTEP